METYVLYINNKVHALNLVLPMLENSDKAKWVLVGCPPRLSRHSSKWLTRKALKKFKSEWTELNLREIEDVLRQRGHEVLTRFADGSLIEFTQRMKSEFTNPRVVDARKQNAFENLPHVAEQQKDETKPWLLPVGAIALGTAVTLVAD